MPASWQQGLRAAAGMMALCDFCQLSPCYLCAEKLPEPFLIPSLELLWRRACSHESPIVCQARQFPWDTERCDLLGEFPGCFEGSQCSGS